jgi:hypothetical protein
MSHHLIRDSLKVASQAMAAGVEPPGFGLQQKKAVVSPARMCLAGKQ